jgi:prepilin-type processing-associated H-X9-DG protein
MRSCDFARRASVSGERRRDSRWNAFVLADILDHLITRETARAWDTQMNRNNDWLLQIGQDMWRRACAVAIAPILAVSVLFNAARAQDETPKGTDARASTSPLAGYIPREDLILYLEYKGLDAQEAVWQKTAAYRLLSETKLGALLEDMAIQAIEVYQETVSTKIRVKGVDAVDVLKRVARHGFAFAVSGKPPERSRFVVVLPRADQPEIKAVLVALSEGLRGEVEEKALPGVLEKAGRTLHRFGANQVWWLEKGTLILTDRTKADEILDVIEGRQPSATLHPQRAELFKAQEGFEPLAVGFLDAKVLAPLSSELTQLGLGGLKRVELQWGFDQEALLGILRIVAPSPRAGALALLDQPSFGIGSLPRIPAKVSGLTVVSIDLAKSYDLVDSLIKVIGPAGTTGLKNPVIMEQQGLDLRKDLLANLGPKLAFYTQSDISLESNNAAELAASRAAGSTISVEVRDRDKVGRAIDPLIRAFGPFMRQRFRFGARDRQWLIVASLSFHRTAGPPHPQYAIDWPANSLVPPYSTLLRPTLTVGENEVVLAASNEAAQRALAGGKSWQPAEAFVPCVRRLPAQMIYMRLADPRSATPVLVASLPVLIRQFNAEIMLRENRAGKNGRDVYLRLDPEIIPKVEDVNGRLFPSSTTVTVDGEGAILCHREAFPTISSPAAVAAVIAYSLPAIRAGVDAARRAQCVNNLKQIALAMHNYVSANNKFPRAASWSESGKPLLSWRVAILPYLGYQELYNKFNLDEPWDSVRNKALIKEMPPVYLCPDRVKAESFTTCYQVIVGKNAIFEKDQDVGVVDVTDGTSNTLLVVEAKDGVSWTKPDDLTFDPAAAPSLCGAASAHPGGFNAAMGDGSVRFIRETIDPKKFRFMITRNQGEILAVDDF